MVRFTSTFELFPETDHWGYVNDKIVMQGEVHTGKINKLKGQVRMMLQKVVDPLEQLELIDILQKLGLSYHFECEVKSNWS